MQTEFGVREFELPVRVDGVLAAMTADAKVPRTQANPAQAARVAWRIAKEWLEVQAALIDAHLASTEEVFMPWMVDGKGRTTYELYRTQQLALDK